MFNNSSKSQNSTLKPFVLIVDDVASNLDILSNILKNENYEIMSASSGEKALSLIAESLPDLILLDVMLPNVGGFEICKKLRETKSTPVIMLSALSDEENHNSTKKK